MSVIYSNEHFQVELDFGTEVTITNLRTNRHIAVKFDGGELKLKKQLCAQHNRLFYGEKCMSCRAEEKK